jgi:elongation factor Ts
VVTHLIATIGENMRLRRSARLSVSQGAVALYLHNAQGDGVGKLGVLVALEGAGDQAVLKEVGRKIALHVPARPPRRSRSAKAISIPPPSPRKSSS